MVLSRTLAFLDPPAVGAEVEAASLATVEVAEATHLRPYDDLGLKRRCYSLVYPALYARASPFTDWFYDNGTVAAADYDITVLSCWWRRPDYHHHYIHSRYHHNCH